MSFVTRQAAHCDQCSHEWLTLGTPMHCAKCKSRRWNQNAGETLPANSTAIGDPIFVKRPSRNKMLTTEQVGEVMKRITDRVSGHDPRTCNVYKCGMCAAVKA